MKPEDLMQVSFEDLEWALLEYARLDMNTSGQDFAGDDKIADLLSEWAGKSPEICAGFEVGLKCGLMLALRAATKAGSIV